MRIIAVILCCLCAQMLFAANNSPASSGESTTKPITLKNGENGYQGTSDNSIYEGYKGLPEDPLEDYEDNTNGGGTGIYAGVIVDGWKRRGLIKFDLTHLPPGIDINNARLVLTVDRSKTANEPYTIHRLTRDWGEGIVDAGDPGGEGEEANTGDATWTHSMFGQIEWSNPGGDFVTSPSATADVFTTAEFSSQTMVADIEKWISKPETNYGWIILGNEAEVGNAKSFISSEGFDFARPYLEIEAIFSKAAETYDVIVNDAESTLTLDANNDLVVDSADLYLHLFPE